MEQLNIIFRVHKGQPSSYDGLLGISLNQIIFMRLMRDMPKEKFKELFRWCFDHCDLTKRYVYEMNIAAADDDTMEGYSFIFNTAASVALALLKFQ